MAKLTNIEAHFINRLSKVGEAYRVGNRFYLKDNELITKRVKISSSNIEKLREHGLIEIRAGGKIRLAEKQLQI